jgi:hypothetical protein
LTGVELLNAAGKRVAGSDKASLATVTQVRIAKSVPLSSCDGNAAIKQVDDLTANGLVGKAPRVSVGTSTIPVQSLGFPKLRSGTELVEFALAVPADRVLIR